MSRKQLPSPEGPTGKGAQNVHGNGQPNPNSTRPKHVIARSPAAVNELGRGTLPEWVRQRGARPERAGSNPNPETPDVVNDFLTVAELAKILRVSVRTLRRRLAAGEIPHFRVGRQVRIPRKAVLVG